MLEGAVARARRVLEAEAEAIRGIAGRVGEEFERAVEIAARDCEWIRKIVTADARGFA
jgi:hypothetical protein